MPVHPHRRVRPRPALARCSWEGCRRAGEGAPPLCDVHADEANEAANEFEESVDVVIEGVLDHPQVRKLADRAVGLLDQLGSLIEQVKRGELPRRPQATSGPAPARDPVALARQIFHFAPTEALTEDKIRERKHALARLVHPDAGGSLAEMQRINLAADVLMKTVRK